MMYCIQSNEFTPTTLLKPMFCFSEAVRRYPDSLRAIYGDPYNDAINAVHGSGILYNY